jgi:CheY-like chemotaxis protein
MPPREGLVVDDDSDSRDGLAQLLQAHGYTIRQAENGRISVDMIAAARTRLHDPAPRDAGDERVGGARLVAAHERAQGPMVIVVLSAAAAAPLGVAFMRSPV